MSVPDRATRRDLRALFEPESVAVVGASDDPEKWGNWLARGALRGESRRAVHLVNRRGGEVLGLPPTPRSPRCRRPPSSPCLPCPRPR